MQNIKFEGREKCRRFCSESPKERGHSGDQGVDGIKMSFRETVWEGAEWIRLAQDRDCWRAVVNAVMNLRVLASRS
jgi:hypothetical protein